MAPDADTASSPTLGLPPISEWGSPVDALLRAGVLGAPPRAGLLAVIDRFEIVRLLGGGGMSLVFLACDPESAREVAIKLVRPEFLGSHDVLHRIAVEARHMQALVHPGILPLLEIGSRGPVPYLVMPHMRAGSLAGLLRQEPRPAPERVLEWAIQIAGALGYAHQEGIIHRDLKPSNILLGDDDRAFVADFGLARTLFNDSVVHVGMGSAEGTAPYMSPAVAAGRAEDTRCDIYALGALLYELLAGSPPYCGADSAEIMRQILAGPPPRLSRVTPPVPPPWLTIVEGAMARALRERYAEMGDLLRDLERLRDGRRPYGPARLRRAGRERLLRRVALGVAAVACAALALWLPNPLRRAAPATAPPARLPAHASDPLLPPGQWRGVLPAGFRAVAGAVYADCAGLAPGSREAQERQRALVVASGLPQEAENSLGARFRLVPPGAFTMGTPPEEYWDRIQSSLQLPQRDVVIARPLWVGALEVTRREWTALMPLDPDARDGTPEHPVTWVSWDEAREFVRRLNEVEGGGYRLLTEAEWEYCCRAGTVTAFCSGAIVKPDGHDEALARVGFFQETSGGIARPGGGRAPNAWGLYDMHGNVFEWVEDDWHASYVGAPEDGSAWVEAPREPGRAIRSAGPDSRPWDCRSAHRSWLQPYRKTPSLGFRLAREFVPAEPQEVVRNPSFEAAAEGDLTAAAGWRASRRGLERTRAEEYRSLGVDAADGEWVFLLSADALGGPEGSRARLFQEGIDLASVRRLVFDWHANEEHVRRGDCAFCVLWIGPDGQERVLLQREVWSERLDCENRVLYGVTHSCFAPALGETIAVEGLTAPGTLAFELSTIGDWCNVLIDHVRAER